MLKISAVYLIGKAEIPIHYTSWSQVEQALSLLCFFFCFFFCFSSCFGWKLYKIKNFIIQLSIIDASPYGSTPLMMSSDKDHSTLIFSTKCIQKRIVTWPSGTKVKFSKLAKVQALVRIFQNKLGYVYQLFQDIHLQT